MVERERKRGGCLTAFLVFMLIANALSVLGYLFGSSAIRTFSPNIPTWSLIASGVLSVLNIVFALGIWKFKKWGFFGFAAVSIAAFIINLATGIPIYTAVFGLVGIIILYFLVKPVWNQLE